MRILGALLAACAAAPAMHLLPLPAQVESAEGRLRITHDFCIAAPASLQPAAARLTQRLAQRTGLRLNPQCGGAPTLELVTHSAWPAVQRLGDAESYRLEVSPTRARLTAETPLGALRGMETFYQLIESGPQGWWAPAATINDAPRFAWRGLHIDVSRHWMPKDVIIRNLDAMAAVKLNVLHWHLSDDQGFRMESKRYPRLQQLGSDGHFYTQTEAQEVIAYARDRGIRVVPEFDVPAHASAWLVGYPELGSYRGPYKIGRTWGIFEPTLDPTKQALYEFLDGFIGEMATLFPDEYFHIGGDEVNGKAWNTAPQIAAFKKERGLESNLQLHAYFNMRLQAIVKKHGKRMEGWDEILDPALPKDIVIQSWRGQKSLAEAARLGYEGILSAPWYLDSMKSSAQFYAADPLEGESAGLSPEDRKRILGGEACAWSEFLTPENIDSRLWPRTAAVAERLWSPQQVKDPLSLYTRLGEVSHELESLGIRHIAAYKAALARLAGLPRAREPLTVLADVVRPVNLGGRQHGHLYTQQTPLNRLCDIAQPESERARLFSELVANNGDKAELRKWLTLWRQNDGRLQPLLEGPARELAPVSTALAQLAAAGLTALQTIESGRKMDATGAHAQRALAERAGRPQAEVVIAITPAILKLIDRASEQRSSGRVVRFSRNNPGRETSDLRSPHRELASLEANPRR